MAAEVDFQKLVNQAGDAIIVADKRGNIIYWNAAATRIFGFTRDQALASTLDLIIPERFRQRHWDGYHKTMANGQTRYGEQVLRVPATHKNGQRLSIAFSVTLLMDADDKVEAIAAVVRDESERWQEERELRKRLRELEAASGS